MMRDLADILTPIPGDAPCGLHLRYDPIYDQLQDLRREDDQSAPRGIWQTKMKVADWGGLVDLASQTLATRSKDLQIAAWLVEGMTARQGLLGLAAGLDMLSALSQQYWTSLWPEIGDDGDLDGRMAPFDWLDDKLPQRIAMVGISDSEPLLTWHGYLSAQRRAASAPQVTGRKAKGESEAADAALEEAFAAVEGTETGFYLRLADALALVTDRLNHLRNTLSEQAGLSASSFTGINQMLTSITGFVRAVLLDRGALPQEEQQMAQAAIAPLPEGAWEGDGMSETDDDALSLTDGDGDGQPGPQAPAGVLMLRDRDSAYRALTQIAAYLERTEPHSPVPHLIMRAVAWGQMSLPELLTELMSEGGDVFRLLGLERAGGGAATPPRKGR